MSDEHIKSLHEELLSAFMHRAQLPDEIAAANEIDRLRKELAEARKKPARKPKAKGA